MVPTIQHSVENRLPRYSLAVYRLGARTSALLILVCVLLIVVAGVSANSTLRMQFGQSSSDAVQLHVERHHLSVVFSHGAQMTPSEVRSTSGQIAAALPVSPSANSQFGFDVGVCGIHSLRFPSNISFDLIHISLLVPILVLLGYHVVCRRRILALTEAV